MNRFVDVFDDDNAFAGTERPSSLRVAGGRPGNGTLLQIYERLRRLAAGLLDRHEAERRRIATELHDGLAQSLSMIKFGIEEALHRRDSGARVDFEAVLEDLREKVGDAIAEVRQVSVDLRPSILDDFGLLAALTWLLRELQRTYPEMAVRQEIGIADEDVPKDLKTTIYRCVEEALYTFARHTRDASVCLRFGIGDGAVALTIDDSASGVDLTPVMAQGGDMPEYGLVGLRDRALLSGGDCRIDFRAGLGTRIALRWPLH